jgi:hypothetical protein
MKNEEVLHRVKDDSSIQNTLQRRTANWIGHILRRNCLLKHGIEGKLKVKGHEEKEVSSYRMTLRKWECTAK